MSSLHQVILGAAVAALSTLATVSQAQAPAASAPDTVGVPPSTAQDAMQKAVPRSDTATVIQSGESAADKARDAAATVREGARDAAGAVREGAREVREEAGEARDRAADAVRPDTPAATTGTMTDDTARSTMRAPRADRN